MSIVSRLHRYAREPLPFIEIVPGEPEAFIEITPGPAHGEPVEPRPDVKPGLRLFKFQQEAVEWLRKTRGQIEQGLTYDSTRTTLGELLAGWLKQKKTRLRVATGEQYDWAAANYLAPGLGEVKLRDLTPARIQRFYDDLLARETGARTIQVVHAVLHGCLDHAARLGLTARNPADGLIVPKPVKTEMMVWTESQVSAFLIHVQGQRNEILYHLALATGMRRGELLGLKWGDVDWPGSTIRVQRQVFEPQGASFVFQEPKSERGRRSIELGIGLIERLREQSNRVALARQMARGRWQEYDLIFPSGVGTPQGAGSLHRDFKRLVLGSGLPALRFHDCRHIAASIMLSHGIPLVIVAGILGHSLAVLMDKYAHFIPNMQSEAARLMDGITSPVAVDIDARRRN